MNHCIFFKITIKLYLFLFLSQVITLTNHCRNRYVGGKIRVHCCPIRMSHVQLTAAVVIAIFLLMSQNSQVESHPSSDQSPSKSHNSITPDIDQKNIPQKEPPKLEDQVEINKDIFFPQHRKRHQHGHHHCRHVHHCNH
ncbi:hypothetical protein GCK32_008308 [Trichostrongylus colubriformis]|uniref:Uncharacterized protein n=1 Tax=Trichostrongylus colubriformis TaxID=6319 RepID=A0AAN8FP48_TRICO